jgi:hypothetical protein
VLVAANEGRVTLALWLRTSDADGFVDSAVLGDLPAYEADEVLADHGMESTRENRNWLRAEIDAALAEGR